MKFHNCADHVNVCKLVRSIMNSSNNNRKTVRVENFESKPLQYSVQSMHDLHHHKYQRGVTSKR